MEKYIVSKKIEILKQEDKSIMFNPEHINPVYFPAGGEEVMDILNELKENGSFLADQLPKNCSADIFNFLKMHSLVVPESFYNRPVQKKCNQCGNNSKLSHARSVYLLLTQSCNQACIYCLNGKETYEKEKNLMMSEEVAYKSLDTTIESIAENGRMEVVFFGGEPLMNWELAKKIIDYCKKVIIPKHPTKKIHYHLTTNLTIFPNDLIYLAKENNITFLVDIDGPEEIHNTTRPFINGKGSFKTTADNINKLINAGIKVSLRATVTSHNDTKMLEVAKTHKELGGQSCAFVPLNPVDSDINILDTTLCPSTKNFAKGLVEVFNSGIWEVERLFPFNEYMGRLQPGFRNQWGCGAPFGNTPVITSTGNIYSCIYLVGNEQYEVGHIMNGNFPKKEVLDRMLKKVNVNNRESCKKCSFRYLCGGGCPVGVFSINGNPKATPEIKRYVQEMSCTVSKTVLNQLFWNMAGKIIAC